MLRGVFISLILLVNLFSRVEASTARVLQELATIGMKTQEGRRILSRILSRPVDQVAKGEGGIKSVVDALLVAEEIKGESVSNQILAGLIGENFAFEFHGKNLSHGEFPGINLSEVKIINIEFNNADLRRGNFTKAELTNGDFSQGKLNGANFYGAKIAGAKFVGADLSESNFRKVYFTSVDLSNATLSGADFRGSNLDWARLEGAIYDSKTRLPPFFSPKARGMVSVKGKQHNRYTYFVVNGYNAPLLIQCGVGAAMGAGATFGLLAPDSHKSLPLWDSILRVASVGIALYSPILINGFVVTNKVPTATDGTRIATSYGCIFASGAITGAVLHD